MLTNSLPQNSGATAIPNIRSVLTTKGLEANEHLARTAGVRAQTEAFRAWASWQVPVWGGNVTSDQLRTPPDLNSLNAIGDTATKLLFFTWSGMGPILSPQALGLDRKDFGRWSLAQMERIAALHDYLADHAHAKLDLLPADGKSRAIVALGSMSCHALSCFPFMSRYHEYGDDPAWKIALAKCARPKHFGAADAFIPGEPHSVISNRAGANTTPIFSDEHDRIAEIIGEAVRGSREPSLLDLRKEANVRDAEFFAAGLVKVGFDEVDRIYEIVLRGIHSLAGAPRAFDCSVSKRHCARPKEIKADLTRWLRKYNNSASRTNDSDSYNFAFELAKEFQRVHPKVDGNGRAGHVLINRYLESRNLGGFDVPIGKNDEYVTAFDALAKGENRKFETFLRPYRRTTRAISLALAPQSQADLGRIDTELTLPPLPQGLGSQVHAILDGKLRPPVTAGYLFFERYGDNLDPSPSTEQRKVSDGNFLQRIRQAFRKRSPIATRPTIHSDAEVSSETRGSESTLGDRSKTNLENWTSPDGDLLIRREAENVRSNIPVRVQGGSPYDWGRKSVGRTLLAIDIFNLFIPPESDGLVAQDFRLPEGNDGVVVRVSGTAYILLTRFEEQVLAQLPPEGGIISGRRVSEWILAAVDDQRTWFWKDAEFQIFDA